MLRWSVQTGKKTGPIHILEVWYRRLFNKGVGRGIQSKPKCRIPLKNQVFFRDKDVLEKELSEFLTRIQDNTIEKYIL